MTPIDVNVDRQRWYWTLNAVFLLLTVSMYVGTGWSLVLFSFPIAPKLTTATYYMQFVPQVDAATRFFTYMTMAMLASAALMIMAEWRTGYAWVPVIVLLLVIAATWLTRQSIFPLNAEMSAGITTQARLDEVLGKWMRLNTIRVLLWTVQWVTISSYFGLKAARAPRTL